MSYPFPSPFLRQSHESPSVLAHAKHFPTTGLLLRLFPYLWSMYVARFCHLIRGNFPDLFSHKLELSYTKAFHLLTLLYFSPLHFSSSNILSLWGFVACYIPGTSNCFCNINICWMNEWLHLYSHFNTFCVPDLSMRLKFSKVSFPWNGSIKTPTSYCFC